MPGTRLLVVDITVNKTGKKKYPIEAGILAEEEKQ